MVILHLVELTLPAADALQRLFHSVEGTLQAYQPARQGEPLALQSGPQAQDTVLLHGA
jgi:hypothetical protein